MFWIGLIVGFFLGSLAATVVLAFFMGLKSGDEREPG
jgi:hypothetical protein